MHQVKKEKCYVAQDNISYFAGKCASWHYNTHRHLAEKRVLNNPTNVINSTRSFDISDTFLILAVCEILTKRLATEVIRQSVDEENGNEFV